MKIHTVPVGENALAIDDGLEIEMTTVDGAAKGTIEAGEKIPATGLEGGRTILLT